MRQPSDVEAGVASVKAEGRRTVLMRVKNGDQIRFRGAAGRQGLTPAPKVWGDGTGAPLSDAPMTGGRP